MRSTNCRTCPLSENSCRVMRPAACLLKDKTGKPWNNGKLIGAKPPLRPNQV
jgi:hypothetical protein